MKIDLSSIDVFKENEIDFDKKITFIFGKNGTGKSTLANEIKKLDYKYDVSIFQGFENLIDQNKHLNAVVLGEENAEISRKIEAKKIELETKLSEIEAINKTLQKPDDEKTSNYWTRKIDAEKEYENEAKKIDDFYSKSASRIKKINDPHVATVSYNKRNFQDDLAGAVLLSKEDLEQNKAIIKSETKYAHDIAFPIIDFQKLENETNSILKKKVIEKVKLSRLENNPQKREFAQLGLKIHKMGEICAFCGNKIQDESWNELVSYFSADDVKLLRNEIQCKINELDSIIVKISEININLDNFYPNMISSAKEVKIRVEEEKKDAITFLNKLKNALDDKFKFLFEECAIVDENYSSKFESIEKVYEEIKINNNENDLTLKKNEATDRIRKHYVKCCLDEFNYDARTAKLSVLNAARNQRISEYNSEEEKINGPGGLNEKVEVIQNEIISLQNKTKNEKKLADNINKKLKHMVSFELVHFEDKESKGYYRVKNSINGCEREITELSTGEKNVIAFLYFIEKLDEVRENASSKPRVIVFDDPMSSNDDGMQYLIIEELQKLMKSLYESDHFILMTHNKHFYLNVKYGHKYRNDSFIRFQSDGKKTCIIIIKKEDEDFKTSYEALWCELKTLFNIEAVSADLLLNPIRRIIETYTKFNAINKDKFCGSVDGAMKLFNVNSHSIDDVEAELNGKTKKEIIQMFYDCFYTNDRAEHFRKLWNELETDEQGKIFFCD